MDTWFEESALCKPPVLQAAVQAAAHRSEVHALLTARSQHGLAAKHRQRQLRLRAELGQ